MSLIASYGTGNYTGSILNVSAGASYRRAAQTFTLTSSYTISDFQFYMQVNGSPTGSVNSYITNLDPSTFAPNATLITGGTVSAGSIGGTMSLITFTTGSNLILTAGSYAMVIEYLGGDASNYVSVGCDNTSPTDPGQVWAYNGSSWLNGSTLDAIYTLNGSASTGSGNMLPILL